MVKISKQQTGRSKVYKPDSYSPSSRFSSGASNWMFPESIISKLATHDLTLPTKRAHAHFKRHLQLSTFKSSFDVTTMLGSYRQSSSFFTKVLAFNCFAHCKTTSNAVVCRFGKVRSQKVRSGFSNLGMYIYFQAEGRCNWVCNSTWSQCR